MVKAFMERFGGILAELDALAEACAPSVAEDLEDLNAELEDALLLLGELKEGEADELTGTLEDLRALAEDYRALANGMPELAGQRPRIAASSRVANPGCHASGFIALVAPLVAAGILAKDARLSCFSITGYSGGGKKMIAQYEADARDPLLGAPRQYSLTQAHKHLPEMAAVCALEFPPVFSPIVADFYSGMEVSVPLFGDWVSGGVERVREVYADVYRGPVIRYAESADEGGFLSAAALSGRDDMQISVAGNDERLLLTARFDNLGKGASGAAIQNMNILMGVDETEGLALG